MEKNNQIDAKKLLSQVDAKLEVWEKQIAEMNGNGPMVNERKGMVLGLKHFRSLLVKEINNN